MKKFLKTTLAVLVTLVVVGWIWWDFFRVSAEDKANDQAANAILQSDGHDDEDLGDLDDEMKSLGVDSDDEAEADKLLDELLDD